MTNEPWLNFLTQQGACITEGTVKYFKQQQEELAYLDNGQSILVSLNHLGLLSVTSASTTNSTEANPAAIAKSFLQGQLSCNLDDISFKKSSLGSYCDIKGRVTTSFRIFEGAPKDSKSNNSIFLSMHHSLVSDCCAELNKYGMFSKVKTSDCSDNYICFGVAGNGISKHLESRLPSLPKTTNDCVHGEELSCIRLNGDTPRFLLMINIAKAESWWKELSLHAHPSGLEAWTLTNIRAGIALVDNESSGKWLPQELNYHALDAVSFNKGCYRGQEIVARMFYRGKLKKNLLYLSSNQALSVGQLLKENKDDRSSAGQVISVARNSQKTYELLAVIRHNIADNSAISLNYPNETNLEVKPLPYAIPIKES